MATAAVPSATKERILEAAEELFVQRGFAAASLRAVTSAAGVNLAAVHYHFQSKEGLFEAVVQWRIAPVTQEQLKRLEQLEAQVGAETPSVEEILEAYLAPVLTTWQDQPSVPRLVGRLYGEPHSLVHPLLERAFGDLGRRFLATLIRAVPGVDPVELMWRFLFTIGALVHMVTIEVPIELLPGVARGDESPARLLDRLVRFAAAGLRGDSTQETGS